MGEERGGWRDYEREGGSVQGKGERMIKVKTNVQELERMIRISYHSWAVEEEVPHIIHLPRHL